MEGTDSKSNEKRDLGNVTLEQVELGRAKAALERESSSATTGSLHAEGPQRVETREYDANVRLGVAVRRYPKASAYYLALTAVVVGWGLDLVIVGSITGVEAFQRDYGQAYKGDVIIPAHWLALWLASTPMGLIFGAIFGGYLQDVVGRRRSLLVGSLISGIGIAIIFTSYLPAAINSMRVMFFMGKVIQGFSIGILKVTAMTYISETAPVALRGSAMALIPVGNLLGQLLGSIVIFLVNEMQGRTGYLIAFGVQWVLVVVPLTLSFVMPESPAYLLAKNQDAKAVKASKGLFAPRADALEATERMRQSLAEEKALSVGTSYLTCFRGSNRRRTFLIIIAGLYPTMFGLDLLARASYFLQTMGVSSSLSLIMLIAGVVAGIVTNLIGVWVMSRLGRRNLTMWTLGIASVLWGAMGIAGFFKGSGVHYFSTAIMTVVTCVCGVGVWPASYAIIGETSSLRLRAKTQAIGTMSQQCVGILMSFVLAYVYNPDAGNMGAKTGFVFCGFCIIGVVLTWYMLPELKGRTAMDIDEMFKLGLPTRQFKRWKRDDTVVVDRSPEGRG